MDKINRVIEETIEKWLFKGKIIVVYGPRQVGKTTLIKKIQQQHAEPSLYLDCDQRDTRDALTNKTSTELRAFLGNHRLIFLDEAQRVENIGLTLKLLADNFPELQIVATGSSSFDLSNKISEPLTGRALTFYLFPFAAEELFSFSSALELQRLLETRMIFGMYPEVVLQTHDVKFILQQLTQSYLFKDVLAYQYLKKPEVLEKILQALALQIGHEVSYNELGRTIGADAKTIQQYIFLLEQTFIIFRLPPLTRNRRKEISKSRKIYFYDTGIRNALINNFNVLDLRQDVGALWENFIMSERKKFHFNHVESPNMFFWRTYQQQEVDLVEEEGGLLHGYEFKWSAKKRKMPKSWKENYPEATWEIVDRENWLRFVGIS